MYLKVFISVSPSCNENFFSCGDNTSQCIPWPWVCDNDPECPEGSDELEDLCKNSGRCGGDFTASNGFLTSPAYPDAYPNNKDCIYTISPPNSTFLNLQIEMFDMQYFDEDRPCDSNYLFSDYLEIRDGGTENSPLIGMFCGTKIPAYVQSTTNQVWIK